MPLPVIIEVVLPRGNVELTCIGVVLTLIDEFLKLKVPFGGFDCVM